MNGFTPSLDCRLLSHLVSGQGSESLKILDRSPSDFERFFS